MEIGSVEIKIDGEWELDDLGELSKKYTHAYSLIYSLNSKLHDTDDSEFQFEYLNYPWRGGYSVVNFYYKLYSLISREERPKITRIQYNSPGAIELSAALEVALQLSAIIGAVTFSFNRVLSVIKSVSSGMREHKLGRIEVEAKQFQLNREQHDFVVRKYPELIEALNITPDLLDILDKRTNGNKLVQIKILMSLYRRIEPICELSQKEMVNLINNEEKFFK